MAERRDVCYVQNVMEHQKQPAASAKAGRELHLPQENRLNQIADDIMMRYLRYGRLDSTQKIAKKTGAFKKQELTEKDINYYDLVSGACTVYNYCRTTHSSTTPSSRSIMPTTRWCCRKSSSLISGACQATSRRLRSQPPTRHAFNCSTALTSTINQSKDRQLIPRRPPLRQPKRKSSRRRPLNNKQPPPSRRQIRCPTRSPTRTRSSCKIS